METIDTRDLYTRKLELEELRDAVTAAWDELVAATQDNDRENEREELDLAHDEAVDAFGEDEQAELEEIEGLENDISEFRSGAAMILERDFEGYARELAEETGAISNNATWPCTCIDWKEAAEELAQAYSTVTYQGDDYYVRN